MDALAMTAATLVAKWAAEGLVKEAGKSAWAGLTKLYDTVRAKLSATPGEAAVLARLEEKPDSQARTLELAEVLEPKLSDPAFTAELKKLIADAQQNPGLNQFVTTVSGNAKIGKLTTIGTVHGNVTI